MANNIAYELIVVGATATGPTASLVSGKSPVCAIFYLDPDSPGDVRYRADQTDPRPDYGLPIRPGRHLVVAGRGDITNARFISRNGGRCELHALYYDQVDVIAFDMGSPAAGAEPMLASLLERSDGLLHEMRALRVALMVGGVAADLGDRVEQAFR